MRSDSQPDDSQPDLMSGASGGLAHLAQLGAIAWRNLWRNRRRTLITLASIVFGVSLAVISTAMQDRNWMEMIDLAARLGGGHVSVQHVEYRDHPTAGRVVGGVDEMVRAAEALPEVQRALPRVLSFAMLNTAHESGGAALIAYDPDREDETTLAVLGAGLEGEALRADDRRGVVLGARLAQNLGLDLGDKVVYTLSDRDGEITGGLGRLRATVTTGSPALDAALCLVPIAALRSQLGLEADEATQVAVFLDDQRAADDVAASLGQLESAERAVLTWRESRPELAGFIAMKVGGAVVVNGLIGLLVAAGIFNTLFVSVMERQREFGVLTAIGWSSRRLFGLVMLESLWLGLVGLVLAAVVTIGPYMWLAANGLDLTGFVGGDQATDVAGVAMPLHLKVGIFPINVVRIGVLALLAVLLSGLLPAWRAGRVDPVEAINQG